MKKTIEPPSGGFFVRLEDLGIYAVADHALWIGNCHNACDFRALFDLGIRAIVQLAMEEKAVQPPRELMYFRFPLTDGAGNDPEMLRLAVGTLANLIRLRIPAIVCCSAGLSRSPTVVAAALSQLEGLALEECLKRITMSHPADVSPGLISDLQALCG